MRELVTEAARNPGRRLIAVTLVLTVYAGLTAGLYRLLARQGGTSAPSLQLVAGSSPPRRKIELRDGQFFVAGEQFVIKAVGWDPARPAELPWNRRFVAAEVDADFRRIHEAGFNTVRTWAPMRTEELELAARNQLRVLQGIWTPPDADFRDPELRRRILDQVARSVESSRWSPAILGYLVLNEPRASAVAHAGLDATTAYLREVVATVRALDPSAPVGYASWPGLEALDDDLLDFVAFNLYPHRPRVAMDELGVVGYAGLLRDTIARGRPFIVSEFGLSVSPQVRAGRGGSSEREQADGLVAMASSFAAAGVAGTAVFQWNDGWWKNNDRAGDEFSHDPDDPEEWFGLISFEGPGDRLGSPRPALAALARYNRALVISPVENARAQSSLPVRIFSDEPVQAVATLDGARVPLLLTRTSSQWLTGKLTIAQPAEAHELRLELRDHGDNVLGVESRSLRRSGEIAATPLLLLPRRLTVRPGARFSLSVELPGAESKDVLLSAYSEDRYEEQPQVLRLDRAGRGRVTFTAPGEETMLTVLALEQNGGKRAAPRRAGWAAVEVRKTP